jgi:hypothetical protein
MTVYNVVSTVVLNVEATSPEEAQLAADHYVERSTGGTVIALGADLDTPPFEAESGTALDINAVYWIGRGGPS